MANYKFCISAKGMYSKDRRKNLDLLTNSGMSIKQMRGYATAKDAEKFVLKHYPELIDAVEYCEYDNLQ